MFPLPKKLFVINLLDQINYPTVNTIVFFWAKMFVENFLFLSFFGNLFFVVKFTVSTFISVNPITKGSFRTVSVLFPTLIKFYKIDCVFGISIKCLVHVISFIRISLFKSWRSFHQLTQLTRRLFSTAWTSLSYAAHLVEVKYATLLKQYCF